MKIFYDWGQYNMKNCIKGVPRLGRLRTTAINWGLPFRLVILRLMEDRSLHNLAIHSQNFLIIYDGGSGVLFHLASSF